MTNGSDVAFAQISKTPFNQPILMGGLTKREYFAAMALQGYTIIIEEGQPEQVAKMAVEYADALVAALDGAEQTAGA